MKKIIVGFLFILLGISFGEEKKLISIDYFSGYGYAKLERQDDYIFSPFCIDFTYPIPFSKKDSQFQFQLEPFFSYVSQPDTNAEIGLSFFFKYRFFKEEKLQPYIRFGSGIIYITQDTYEQSTNYNFVSQLGTGLSYFLKNNFGVAVEYRYRHISNAGIKEPNSGIDSRLFLFGIIHSI